MIREFYQGRSILLTGGTGFLGQGLAAKILRDLPGVKRLYVLIRGRRQADGTLMTAGERLENELFQADVFARLRREDPGGFDAARARTQAIDFDMAAPGLGIGAADRHELEQHVDCIISAAATVVFDEPLDQAVRVNTMGPRQLLDLARGCRKTVTYVHVSTAYVSGQLVGEIAEEPLPEDRTIQQWRAGAETDDTFDPAAEVASCLDYCDAIRARAESPEQMALFRKEILNQRHNRRLTATRLDKLVEDRRKRWVERQLTEEGVRRAQGHGWNDVYTFTKAMGEQLLTRAHGEVPLVIVRPSIVESSLADPEPGWIFGLKVADPLIVGYGRGLVADFPTSRDVVMDLVPVDIVVNTIIAAGAHGDADSVKVFHAATSGERPLTMQQLYDYVRGYFQDHPMRGKDGRAPDLPEWTFPSPDRFKWLFRLKYLYPLRLQQWLLGRLPNRLAPAGRKRRLAAVEKRVGRVLYYAELFGPYTKLNCRYSFKCSRAMYESLPPDEQALFDMDIQRIEWREYFREIHIPGLRRNVLREEQPEEGLLRESPEEPGAEEEQWRVENNIQTLPDLLRWSCARYGEAIALRSTGTESTPSTRELTYAQFQQKVDALAEYWQSLRFASGDCVVLCAENGPDWVIAYMSASCLGLTVVPVDPQTRSEEVWALMQFTTARALLVSTSVWERLGPTAAAAGYGDLPVLDVERDGRRVDAAAPAGAPSPSGKWRPSAVDPDQVASIVFLSGTLVTPRGVMLSHRNFVADVLALAEVHRVTNDDRVLSVLPLHHCLEFTGGMLLPLLGGASITYLGADLNSRAVFAAMQEHGITAVQAVPRLLKILADRVERLSATAGDNEAVPELDALKRLRLVVSGGAPLPQAVFEQYRRLGVLVHEGYGLTEAAPIVTVSPPGAPRPGSVGQALPGIEIGVEAPDGEGVGEILVRGPTVMRGYLHQTELTDATLRNGWLHTGDLGRMDQDGYLWVTGRRKQLVVTGAGRNVYPEEVEMLYADLPHVVELAVVGVVSPRTLSEEVHGVAVVERTSCSNTETLESSVRGAVQRISASVPSHQRIRELHLWHRPLPRLDSGAVDRAALRGELARAKETAVTGDVDALELADWERNLCQRIAAMTGLTLEHVVAHADAPLDMLMDSLMALEFASVLERHLDGHTPAIDRSRMTLRQLLEHLGAQLAHQGHVSGPEQNSPAAPYWSQVLNSATADLEEPGVPPGREVGARPGHSLLWRGLGPLFSRFCRITVSGAEQLPQDRPYLIAANNHGRVDALAVVAGVRRHVEHCHLLAEQEYFRRWLSGGRLVQFLLGGVAFDRDGDLRSGLVMARSLAGVRRPVLMFPEAGRSQTGHLQPFKIGVGLLACELDLPVLPVHISDGCRGPAAGARTGSRRRIQLRIGKPLCPEPFRNRPDLLTPYDVYREIAEALRRRIQALGADSA